MDTIGCRRAEELLSDHLDGTLAEPLAEAVAVHLGACARCTELRDALGEVVGALRSLPAVEPPSGLAERAAAAALAFRARARRLSQARLPWPARLQPLPIAAALALAVGAVVLLATPKQDPLGPARRLAARTEGARAYLAERKERLVGDIHRVGVLVGAALEMRLEDVHERVDDYRRWLVERSQAGGPQQGARATRRRTHVARLSFSNPPDRHLVAWCERTADDG
jgi:predicted anti-sigma-YlaC factor YlaD